MRILWRSVSFEILVILLTVMLLAIPVIVAGRFDPDFRGHLIFANLLQEELYFLPHFLYHISILGVRFVLPSVPDAIWVSLPIILAHGLLAAFVAYQIRLYLPIRKHSHLFVLAVLSLFATPLYIEMPLPYLLGYINTLPLHNPTQQLLRLFALPVFVVAVHALQGCDIQDRSRTLKWTFLALVLSGLMAISKPNYSLVIVPALAFFVAYRWWRGLPVNWITAVFGIIVPLTLILGLQYLITFNETEGNGIGFGMMKAILLHITIHELMWRVGLSLIFPLTIYLLYFRQATGNLMLNFAWAGFLIGCAWGYFTHETGARFPHGNQLWTTYISLFVLMYASFIFMLQQRQQLSATTKTEAGSLWSWLRASDNRFRLALLVYLLHVLSGIRYAIELVQYYLVRYYHYL